MPEKLQEIMKPSCIRKKRMNNLSEEQKLIRRKRIQRARKIRSVISTLLVLCLIVSIGVAVCYMFLYRQALRDYDQKAKELESLKSEIESGAYITAEEAEYLSSNAVNKAIEEQNEELAGNTEEDYKALIKEYMEEGKTLSMLENVFPENIVVPDTGGYRFFDIDYDLNMSEVDYSAIEYPVKNEETGKYEGEAYYSVDGAEAKKGVDVSSFQGDIDWNKVKNDGVEYAFIRLGYRGYESGKIVNDNKYEDNITGCNEAGLDCGVYFFTEALNAEEGKEEAEFVLECLEEHHIEMPIVIDVEQSANVSKSRTRDLTAQDRTEAVIAFCERIKQDGYTPMIYGNLKSMLIMLDFERLEEYDKWFAYYHYPLRFPYKHKIWQYTASGKVDGIRGDADLNLMFY